MIVLSALLGCTPTPLDTADIDTEEVWDRGPNPHLLDDVLRLNHIQTKGTHNSYHRQPASVFDDSHRYTHPPLGAQLSDNGVRQLELDLHLTDSMEWQVFHLPVIDDETVCLLLSDCLEEIKAWSDANGWHVPVTVWLEPKDELDAAAEGLIAIGDNLRSVEDVIASIFPPERLFTPDDLRGAASSLPEAIASGGWPLLGDVRGQVMFALLDSGAHRDAYVDGAPALEGRLMFVDGGEADAPYTALVKDGSPESITEWVSAGFIMTSNGSLAGDDPEERAGLDAAIVDAGVNHAATDFSGPDSGGYWLDLPPRCNPVSAPAACDDAEIEKLNE